MYKGTSHTSELSGVPTSALLICNAPVSLPILALARALHSEPSSGRPHTVGEIPEGFKQRRESLHFGFLWHTCETTIEKIDAAGSLAESLFTKPAIGLDEANTPQRNFL
jgi:hypothetical protein